MLIIAIHGFRTLLEPGVWIKSKNMIELLKKEDLFQNFELIELGYKNIIYDHLHGIRHNKPGYSDTLNSIVNKLKMHEDEPVLIIGHSLGGFAASILTQDLVSRGYRVDILVQIDAMPILTSSAVFNKQWIESIEEKQGQIFVHLSDKLDSKRIEDIEKISNRSIDLIQNLADNIDVDKIRDGLIRGPDDPYLHQTTFDKKEVGTHYYYYVDKKAFTIVDKLVEIGTNFETGPIPDERVINKTIAKTHLLIDDDDEIYNELLRVLGSSYKLSDLSVTKRIRKSIDAYELVISKNVEEKQKKLRNIKYRIMNKIRKPK